MIIRRDEPNFIIDRPPVSECPALIDKITCPICCIAYQKRFTPMLACPSAHTVCASCLQGIIRKSIETPQNPPSCPLCRQRMQLPLKTNEEFKELVFLLESVGDLQFQLGVLTQELKQKGIRLHAMEYDIKKKNQDNFQLTKRTKTLEEDLKKIRIENSALHQKIKSLQQGMQNKKNSQTDAQGEQKVERKPNHQNKNSKDIDIDKRPPLQELFYNDELSGDNRLNLFKKGFSILQVEFLTFHDLSRLVELNLACNQIDNGGFRMLMEKSNFENLASLIVANNRISELPTNMETLIRLKNFNIGNLQAEDKRTCNKLREFEFEKMLAQKWQAMTHLDIEFDTELVWENEANLDRFVEQFPVISQLTISTFTMKMSKKKCQNLMKALNHKAKRPGNNRILVVTKSNY